MKKTIIIGGVIVIAAVIIGVAVGSRPSSNEIAGLTGQAGISGTWQDLLSGALGADIKCEFEQNIADQGELKVQTYLSDENMRVDYELSGAFAGAAAEQKNLHIVSDGEYFYMWGESLLGAMMEGIKYKVDYDEEGDMQAPDNDLLEAYMSFEDMPDLNCQKWNVDQGLFEIPEDIEFMDMDNLQEVMMGDLMDGMVDAAEGDESDTGTGMMPDCSMCDMMTGEMQTSCLQSLGCE